MELGANHESPRGKLSLLLRISKVLSNVLKDFPRLSSMLHGGAIEFPLPYDWLIFSFKVPDHLKVTTVRGGSTTG